MRKAAENGQKESCFQLASHMYGDYPYAREVGHVGEATGVLAGIFEGHDVPADVLTGFLDALMEGHDVPPDVLTGVAYWLRKGGYDPLSTLFMLGKRALEGGKHCYNDGCEVVGHLKEFKVCPQCKTFRYCGAACQKQHWTTGGHKERCGMASYMRT
jgi:hypothetical protein